MSRTESPLIEVAAAVSDGSPVDWGGLPSRSGPAARIVRQLRILEQIASVHTSTSLAGVGRGPGEAGSQTPEPEPVGSRPRTWGPLAVLELIGSGSHADVYLAHDPRLDRPVALKLLKHRAPRGEAVVEDETIQEARLLARVRHPNVITVHGAERIDGRVGIWTEFIDGRTLEGELRERGPLPAAALLAVGVAVSGALEAVHAEGLLHRDIKAQNVLRARDGRTLLADFGTSREVSQVASADLAGTPLYLAPEIFRGEAASASSDVYSLGVLLFHLATGTFPVEAGSLAALRKAHGHGGRVPLLRRQPQVPRRLAAVIERACAPEPARRYESAAALGAALQGAARQPRRAPAVVLLAVAMLVAVLVFSLSGRTSTGVGPQVVLVGALDNQTGEPQLDEVVRMALLQQLQQSRELAVAPPERIEDLLRLMRRPSETALDERTALEVSRRDGGIPTLITGRIDRLGARYALQLAAIRSSSGAVIVRATAEADDLDALLDAVRGVAGRIRTALGESARQVDADARLASVTTTSIEALRHYTMGLTLMNEQRWAAAELRLSEAIRLDPGFASALIALANARLNMRLPEAEYLPPAEDAFRLAPALPARERYFITGSYHQLTEDLPRAIAAYEALTREYPNDFRGLDNLAVAYVSSGRYREEIPIAKRLALLRPNDYAFLLEMAMALVIDGDGLGHARSIAERAARLEPPVGHPADVYAAWLSLLPVFEAWAEGRVEAAAAQLDAMEATPPHDDWEAFGRGQLNLSLGRVRAAERAFQAIASSAERTALLAYAAIARGDVEHARTALKAVVAELPGVPAFIRGQGGFGRASTVCWALTRVGLNDGCRDLARLFPPIRVAPWFVAEAAAADGDDATALPILERLQAEAPPGNPQTVMALDTLATLHERRADLAAAAATLTRSESARLTVYPNSGSRGFFWLTAQAHLLRIERERGNLDHAAAIERRLRRLLVAADPDFVLGSLAR